MSLSTGQQDDFFVQNGLKENRVMHPAFFCFLVMPLRCATRIPIAAATIRPRSQANEIKRSGLNAPPLMSKQSDHTTRPTISTRIVSARILQSESFKARVLERRVGKSADWCPCRRLQNPILEGDSATPRMCNTFAQSGTLHPVTSISSQSCRRLGFRSLARQSKIAHWGVAGSKFPPLLGLCLSRAASLKIVLLLPSGLRPPQRLTTTLLPRSR